MGQEQSSGFDDKHTIQYGDIADIVYDINGHDVAYKHARLLSLVGYMNKTLGFEIKIRKKNGAMRTDNEIAREIEAVALTNVERKLMFTGKTDTQQRKIVEDLVKMVNRYYGANILLTFTDFNGEHTRTIEELSDDLYMVFDNVRNKLKKSKGLVVGRIKRLVTDLEDRYSYFNNTIDETFTSSTKLTKDIESRKVQLKELTDLIKKANTQMTSDIGKVVDDLEAIDDERMNTVIDSFPKYGRFISGINNIGDPTLRRQKKMEIVVKALLSLSTNNIKCSQCYEKMQINVGGLQSMNLQKKVAYIRSKYEELKAGLSTREEHSKLLECFNTIIYDIENDMKTCTMSTDPGIVNSINDLTYERYGDLSDEQRGSIRKYVYNIISEKYEPGSKMSRQLPSAVASTVWS